MVSTLVLLPEMTSQECFSSRAACISEKQQVHCRMPGHRAWCCDLQLLGLLTPVSKLSCPTSANSVECCICASCVAPASSRPSWSV